MPYKKQKGIRSNKKDIIYDLMTELGFNRIAITDTTTHGHYIETP